MALLTGALLCAGAATTLAATHGSGRAPRAGVRRADAARLGRPSPPPTPRSPSAICQRIRADSGPIHLAAHRKHLTILATGDSLIYPIDQELAVERAAGMRVVADRHDGTGLTTTTVNWARLSRRQARPSGPT